MKDKSKPLTNPITGVQVTEDTELETLAKELREADYLGKPIDDYRDGLRKLINPHLANELELGNEKLSDYWIIQRGARRFDKSRFAKEASEAMQNEYDALTTRIKEIEEGFKSVGAPFLKHPRIS